MDIKSHVSQAATAAAATVGYLGGVAAGTTERWILSLPRLLKAATDEKLVNLAGKSLVGSTAYGISLKTGKTLGFGLIDRRLSKAGKVMFGVGLGIYTIIGLLAAHELYARSRTPEFQAVEVEDEDLARIIDELHKARGF